ncbi:putative AP superfamily protein [Singulisphaera acidiphila DSM 18658]|uniref:Putative AP superfamily protein n=1 Tax=Singulisphaera acidiphila (strain ATCC BAA-1392 / DSM 18658 / VKM B-2454 / MOB10) TaxID=886293 RepID=L0DKG9_SINAD|nr:putative AP superfamily protein [Singulisphaera acidiphila DSM 18658]
MRTPALAPLVLINAVGLTGRLLAHAPWLRALAEAGWSRSLREVVPAVTCTAQASLLTGLPPSGHGIVGNGWLFRETGEVRFWQQSNALLQAEPLYKTAARLAHEAGRPFRSAQLFWWFNQGAAVDISVTPKPYYGADGNKAFGITGTPDGLTDRLERELGPFPFRTFWGPGAGLPCTDWIARCAASLLKSEPPDLSLVYLPHLDYEPQRLGPSKSDMVRLVGELDAACVPLLDAARQVGARVWVVSEYGHCDVSRPILINRLLRSAGLLVARDGPFGEALDTFQSRAMAVCDHQLAHIYVRDAHDLERVRELLLGQPGVAQVLAGESRGEWGLDHPRSGELVALSEPDAWFAYPYWLDDRRAPDFARTVDIHRKPGYDPCELFFDPALRWPQGRAMLRLAQKKLGFRTLFDLIPLDATLVRGSHGLRAATQEDRPILIGDGPTPSADGTIEMVDAHGLLLRALVPEAEG